MFVYASRGRVFVNRLQQIQYGKYIRFDFVDEF